MTGYLKKNQINILLLILVVFCIACFLVYNKNRVLAADVTEEELTPVVCEEVEMKNPQCINAYSAQTCKDEGKMSCDKCGSCDPSSQVCCCDLGENELEIPIGRAVDQAEYLAEQIINEMGILIQKAEEESEKASEMPGLANQCSISNCHPDCEKKTRTIAQWCDPSCNKSGPGWYETACTGCSPACSVGYICCCTKEEYYEARSCKGDACPFSEIHAKQDEINTLAQAIYESQQKIAGFVAEMEKVFEKLQKSRNRLADCVVRPYEIPALERGEVTLKFMLMCRDILDTGMPIHSYLGDNLDELQEECYGNLYCQVQDDEGKPLPYPPSPCAEDFYCCY